MSISGAFRQHGVRGLLKDLESKILEFSPSMSSGSVPAGGGSVGASGTLANIICENALMVSGGVDDNTKCTISVWVYPRNSNTNFNTNHTPHTIFSQLDEDHGDPFESGHSFLRITSGGAVQYRFRNAIVSQDSATITYNQWNHILISHQGNQSGNDTTHLVVNGTKIADSGLTTQMGAGSDQIIDPDNSFNFCMGFTPTTIDYTAGTNAYEGAIFQFYLNDEFHDMTQSANIQKFRSSGGNSLDNRNLPDDDPLVLITDLETFTSGRNAPGTIVRNRVTTSGLSKP
tara:strand:+ start:497 stop:1357 length:861 start_codon:yes stop_codon:yes gene_type:complete